VKGIKAYPSKRGVSKNLLFCKWITLGHLLRGTLECPYMERICIYGLDRWETLGQKNTRIFQYRV
jgi:hypothetical protein